MKEPIGEIFYNVLIKFPVVWWRQKTRFKIYTRTLNKMTTRTLYNVTVLKLIGNLKKSLIFLKQKVFSLPYTKCPFEFLFDLLPLLPTSQNITHSIASYVKHFICIND